MRLKELFFGLVSIALLVAGPQVGAVGKYSCGTYSADGYGEGCLDADVQPAHPASGTDSTTKPDSVSNGSDAGESGLAEDIDSTYAVDDGTRDITVTTMSLWDMLPIIALIGALLSTISGVCWWCIVAFKKRQRSRSGS